MAMRQFDYWSGQLGGKNGKYRRAAEASHSNPAEEPDSTDAGAKGQSASGQDSGEGSGGASQGSNPGFYGMALNAILNGGYLNNPNYRPHVAAKTELSVGELIGCRCWRLVQTRHGFSLRSMVFADRIWEPGQVERASGEPENWAYGQGIHAFKDTFDMMRDYPLTMSSSIGIVYGCIEMWGVVIEHERGYRAEYARIVSIDCVAFPILWTGLKSEDVRDELRKLYEVTN